MVQKVIRLEGRDDVFEDELNMPNLIIKILNILNIALVNYKNRHLAEIL